MKKTNLKKTTTILSAATIIGIASLASRILGMLRDRILAHSFGAGDDLDIYFTAFRLPDLLYNILIVGVISAAFIPVFSEYLTEKKIRAGWDLASSLINILLLLLISVSVILYFLMPWLINIIAVGFDKQKMHMTVELSRIMLLSPLFFAISNVLSGLLNSFKKFLVYAFAPIMYNVGIIFGALFLIEPFGVHGVAIGVVIGAFLHFAIQVPSALRVGFVYRPIIRLSNGVKKLLKLMIPRTIGLAAFQLNLLASTTIASTLTVGSVTIFNFANNLQSLPVGIFGVSFAIAAFPALSQEASRKNYSFFIRLFSSTFRRIVFFIVPASVLLLLLRAQVVRIILGSGAFDWEDTIFTARTLGFFAVSLFAQSLIPLIARSFFAIQDTKTPVTISVISMVINIFLSFFLSHGWHLFHGFGIVGLAIAFSIASFFNLIALLIFFHYKMGSLDDKRIMISTMKTTLASMIMGIYSYGTLYAVAPLVDMRTFVGVVIQGTSALFVGILVFLLVSRVFQNDEIHIFEKISKTKLKLQHGLLNFTGEEDNESV